MTWLLINSLNGQKISEGPDGSEPVPGQDQRIEIAPGSYDTGLTVWSAATESFVANAMLATVSEVISLQVPVDFGTGGTLQTVAVDAPWLTAAMPVIVAPAPPASFTGVEPKPVHHLLKQVRAEVTTVREGEGFDLTVHAPGRARGIYQFHVLVFKGS